MTLRLRSCLASAGGIPSQIGSIPDPPSAAAVAATVAHLIDVPLSTLPCPFNTAVFTSQVRIAYCMLWPGDTTPLNTKSSKSSYPFIRLRLRKFSVPRRP